MADEKKDDEKKEASKQILIRIAGVLQDPDLCDASFIVEMAEEKKDGEKKEEEKKEDTKKEEEKTEDIIIFIIPCSFCNVYFFGVYH